MIKKWQVTIPELTGEEPRNAYIYLPESYEYDRERRYPVLYMFDGHNVFFDWDATYGKSWGMKEYLDYTETQLIVAAVECNRSPDNGRLSEYSPFDFQDARYGRFKGRGRETMEWFIHSFKREIDAQYRTLPQREFTFIAGSSMGGLMSLYAVLEFNDVFSRAAALSPSVWVAPAKLNRLAKEALLFGDTIVYMDYGSEEAKGRGQLISHFSRLAGTMMDRGIMTESRIVPWGNHSEASWERQLPFFMNTLMYGLND
ncbi:MAG: alpha/beta hydrolase-fold protein [Eubacteriales bacterium]|nr:alpha/beta hydrolase-fold protein [Eubacteriales bacterium]